MKYDPGSPAEAGFSGLKVYQGKKEEKKTFITEEESQFLL